ncbi:MAG: carbohydrate ABC transporter permease [Lacisediminihabitans sp.]
MLIPLYFLLISPFKSNQEIFNTPFALPQTFGFSNFINAWHDASLGPGLLNSVLITVGAEILTIALALPAAFSLARSMTRLSAAVERLFLLGFLIPGFAALVPTVLFAVHLNLLYTPEILIFYFAATALPLSVIVLTAFLRTIPKELEEAARMDGAGWFVVLLRIFLPLSLPGIVTVVLLNFLAFWNEFIFSIVLLGPDPAVRTVQVALPDLTSTTGTQYGLLLAGVLVAFLPPLLVYAFLQKRMQSAMITGAVKG